MAAPVFKKIAKKIYTDTPRYLRRSITMNLNFNVVRNDFQNYHEKLVKEYATMPNLKNMPGMDAIALLENLGFQS